MTNRRASAGIARLNVAIAAWIFGGFCLIALILQPARAADPAGQLTPAEHEELFKQLPELAATSRAFKLVAKLARPGVVHIRVAGGESSRLSEDEIRQYIREHLQERLKEPQSEGEDAMPDRPPPATQPRPPDDEQDRRIREQLKDLLDEQQLEQLDRQTRQRMNEQREQLQRWLHRLPIPPGTGSGIIFDAEGYILTNHHVVVGRERIRVVLHDEREYEARVVGSDPKSDLAVLKIDAPDLQALNFGDSDALEVGDWVLAVGSPFGLEQTVTHGIVSAKGRTRIPGVELEYQDFIQTDAAINPGNSGGPLLNLRGEVVGVNTAIATLGEAQNAGVAFTIPSNRAARIARQLKATGTVRRGWLGISLTQADAYDADVFGLPRPGGIIVERILTGSPAEAAGLQVEDVIVEVEGAVVERSQQLQSLIADLTPGDVARLRVIRDRKALELKVRLGTQPDALISALRTPATDAREIERLGFAVRTFRPALKSQYRLAYPDTARGVLIWRLRSDWPAPRDLEQLDLIVSCNDHPVRTASDLIRVLASVPDGGEVTLLIEEPTGDQRRVKFRLR